MSELKDLFRTPDRSYHPWTYWWWPGSSVDKQELEKQMDTMIATGIGGAVIVPIYAIDEDRPTIEAFTPEWNALVAHTLKAAKSRNFKIWLNIGGGRLPGGSFITEELASHRLAARSQRLRGPRRIDADIWVYAAKTHQSRLGKDVAPYLKLDSIHLLHRDERNRVRERIFIDNPPDRGVRWIWSLEKGIFDLIVCFRYPTGQLVEHASPGWEGFVVDPYNQQATELLIEHTIEAFGDTGARYADSSFMGWYLEGLETPGANYTGDLYEQFQQRRGYDLRQRLPDLWDNLDKDSEGVRQDMLRTLAELQTERFYEPLFTAIEKRDIRLMLQPQGAAADVISLAGRADYPMGESIGPRTYEKYIDARGRRFISSAAHHFGRPVIPAECFTKLHQSRYCISLELMKASSDTVYLGGINHIVTHGFTYSPDDANPPWIYCEPSLIGPPQTWWEYFPHLTAYFGRMNMLLQNSQPICDVLMYAPMADSFARTLESIPLKRGLDNTWGLDLTGEPGIDTGAAMGRHTLPCADPIDEGGYRFDYINRQTLLELAECVDGAYVVRNHSFAVMVFHRVGYLPVEILRKLKSLIEAGCCLVAVGRTPMGLFGKAETEAHFDEFESIMANLYPIEDGKRVQARKVGKGMVYEVETPVDLINLLDEKIGPDVVIAPMDPNFGFCHNLTEDGRHVYFIANCSQKSRSVEVGLRIPNARVERWDPMTGHIEEWACARHENGRLWVAIDFDSYESTVLMVDPDRKPTFQARDHGFEHLQVIDGQLWGWALRSYNAITLVGQKEQKFHINDTPGHFRIPGPWLIEFPAPLNRKFRENKLKCWTKTPETAHFSGTATYTAHFDYDNLIDDVKCVIDLGRVHEVARVTINDQLIGVSWKPPRSLEIPDGALQMGSNTVKIEVTNLGHNSHLLDTPDPRFKPRPDYGQTRAVRGVKKEEPLPSGLHGPVRIYIYKMVRIA